jgi:hypothetical protein
MECIIMHLRSLPNIDSAIPPGRENWIQDDNRRVRATMQMFDIFRRCNQLTMATYATMTT